MTIINLKTEQRKGNYSLLSDRLIEEINLALQNKQKVVLFHNRKGYARRIICSDCRYLWVCPECGSPLHETCLPAGKTGNIKPSNTAGEHETKNLNCAYCKTTFPLTPCPNCKSIKWKSLGYGLQKIKEDLVKQINVKIKIIDSDQSLITNYKLLITKYDILLSTQPPVIDTQKLSKTIGLAAILNADTDFYLPDFTAAMRVFNRIISFKKFCGSFQIKQSIIQTYSIKNGIINAASIADFDQFVKSELASRRKLNYPPYSQLIKLIYQNKNQNNCRQESKKTYNQLLSNIQYPISNIKISPPQPCFIPRIRGNYRYQTVIKIMKHETRNKEQINKILKTLPPQWLIDVDPISLL